MRMQLPPLFILQCIIHFIAFVHDCTRDSAIPGINKHRQHGDCWERSQSLAQQEMLHLFLTTNIHFFQLGHMGRLQLAHRKLREANTEVTNNVSFLGRWHTAPDGEKTTQYVEKDFILGGRIWRRIFFHSEMVYIYFIDEIHLFYRV